MTTPEPTAQSQPLLITAYGAIACGIIIFIAAFIFTLPGHRFKALLIFSASFIIFGIGEYLNHPKQQLITRETVKNQKNRQYHRNRNPCALGNLFVIGGLLMLFIGLSFFFFPH